MLCPALEKTVHQIRRATIGWLTMIGVATITRFVLRIQGFGRVKSNNRFAQFLPIHLRIGEFMLYLKMVRADPA